MSDNDQQNIVRLPVRKRERSNASIKIIEPQYGECQHKRVIVSRKLAELRCQDCNERLNPIEYIHNVANGFANWDYEIERITKARADLDERSKCYCEHCGKLTKIRTVGKYELAKIRAKPSTNGEDDRG